MTSFTDDFDTLDAALTAGQSWEKQIVAGDIIKNATHDLVESTGDGNYLVYGPVFTYTTSTASPVAFTVDRAHGFASGTSFEVVVQNDSHAAINGKWTATSTGTNTFTVVFDNTGDVIVDDGQVRMALSGTAQQVEALVWSNAESASHSATIWARFDRISGPIASVLSGYGARLTWDVSGDRTLDILKMDPITNAIEIMDTMAVTLATFNDDGTLRDLSVGQHLRLVVFDISEASSLLPQDANVMVRAYLNEVDDGQPTLQVVDNGRSRSGQSQPVHRNPGTWAISFGKANDIQYDAFAGIDTYTIPDAGIFRRDYSTLKELREKAVRKVTVGGVSNYNTTYLNEIATAAIQEVITECGDKAHFLERLENIYLRADPATRLVTMPDSVERVYQIFDSTTFEGIFWKMVATDSQGRQRVYIDPVPSAKDFTVYFRFQFVSLENDTDLLPIPKKWEEAAVVGMALRIAEDDGKIKLQASLEKRWQKAIRILKSAMSQINRSKDIRAEVIHRPRIRSRFGRLDLTGFNPFSN